MLCKNCGEDNSLGRTRCLICSASLEDESKEQSSTQTDVSKEAQKKSSPTESMGSWVGVITAIVAFQSAVPYIFTPKIDGSFDYIQMICAGIAGALGGFVGKVIGSKFN
ncbi:hypothetical protein ACIKP9_12300 [Methylobacillus methanolivorans]|uniref:Zinc ribbon domain-containing protein n=1 Tax=Methylobacillus methanolivorans TaxID=1848927 RepID=A0ABW8GNL1_9PROT